MPLYELLMIAKLGNSMAAGSLLKTVGIAILQEGGLFFQN
jgi:hypothetical protein